MQCHTPSTVRQCQWLIHLPGCAHLLEERWLMRLVQGQGLVSQKPALVAALALAIGPALLLVPAGWTEVLARLHPHSLLQPARPAPAECCWLRS